MHVASGQFKKAHASMAMVQFFVGGYTVITKVALNDGVNHMVFCTYRNAVALFILAPVAYFYERNKRPPITKHLLVSFFILGLTGVFGAQILYLVGLAYTDPTYASATQPAIPILTFVLTLIMGTETLNLGKLEGKLKVGGILVCVAGAVLMLLLRGPAVIGTSGLEHYSVQINDFPTATTPKWLLSRLMELGIDRWHIGLFCLIGQCICIATYTSLLGPILAKYPANLSVTAYVYCFGLTFILISTGLFSDCNSTDWSLTPTEVLAVLYAGIVASAINYGLGSWCNKILGPVLMSLYNPLQPVASSFLSTIFLSSPIYIGSIIGGIFIIAGLYMVTWASHRERQAIGCVGKIINGLAIHHQHHQGDEVSEPLLHKDSITGVPPPPPSPPPPKKKKISQFLLTPPKINNAGPPQFFV